MRSLGSELTGPGPCDNGPPSVKPPWNAQDCSCNDMTITMQTATDFRTLCGAMAEGLRSAVFDRHLSRKDECYQGNMAVAAAVHPMQYSTFSVSVNCQELFAGSLSVLNWFSAKYYLLANLAPPATFVIEPDCRMVMCTAFENMLSNPACNFTTNTELNTRATASLMTEIATECQAEGMTLTPESMCAEPSLNESTYCISLFGRRLEDLSEPDPSDFDFWLRAFVEEQGRKLAKATLKDEVLQANGPGAVTAKHLPIGLATQQAVVAYDGVEASTADEQLEDCGGNYCSMDRRLQVPATPTAAATTDANLQEYTVTPWSSCTCYQQCVPGVMTRSVSCPAGVTCKEPKPSPAMSCVCKHCSDCDVLLFVLATAAAYGGTGLISFLLWLGFLGVAQLEEDDYTEMSCAMKCLGCFCRFLPIVIKLMTWTTMLLIILLTVTALVPVGEVFSDCKDSVVFTQLAVGGIIVWVVQLVVGIYMHRNKPMPPWLHTARSSGALKFICRPLNVVGP